MRKSHGTETRLNPDQIWINYSFETCVNVLLKLFETQKHKNQKKHTKHNSLFLTKAEKQGKKYLRKKNKKLNTKRDGKLIVQQLALPTSKGRPEHAPKLASSTTLIHAYDALFLLPFFKPD